MAASTRLKYKVVKCTSEDPDYPVSELLAHSAQTKGWQTARFCEFPQEVGLEFESPVHLRQVQFLSHQSKIATKIELFTALPVEEPGRGYENAQFKRLGYLSLDSNERSQFQARELKSVYVDVSAQFLRILFHKCHVNRYNIVNQVGLIALNCLGEGVGPDLAVGAPEIEEEAQRQPQPPQYSQQSPPQHAPPAQPAPPEQIAQPSQALARGTAGRAPAVEARAGRAPAVEAHATRAPAVEAHAASRAVVPSHAAPVASHGEDERGLDARTAERLRSLAAAKQRAVASEDYEEAKRLKEAMVRLKQTGIQLRDLEERKRQAVQNEDYDTAKALKAEIERLRHAAESNDGSVEGPPEAAEVAPGRAPWPQPATAPRGAHQPQLVMAQGPPAPQPFGGTDLEATPAAAPFGGATFEAPSVASVPGYGGGGGHGPPRPFAGYGVAAPSPTALHGAASPAVPSPSPTSSAGGRSSRPGLGAGSGSGAASAASVGHPLSGVPNAEELGPPEALGAGVAGEAEPLVALFGEYLAQCLYSKSWNLRDAALQKLALDLRESLYGERDPNQLLQGLAIVLRRTVVDKNVQVFSSSCALLQALCQGPLERRGPLQPAAAQAALEPLLPLLAERLGDANARAEKTARDAHLDLARCALVGAPFASHCLLRPPAKKGPPRVYSSRLQVLAALVAEAGVQPDSRDGVPLEPAVQLAMECFNNPAKEIRDHAVRLVGACYARVGFGRIEGHLANLRQAQREVFDAEFERVGGGGAGSGGGRSPSARGGAYDDRDFAFGSGGGPAAAPQQFRHQAEEAEAEGEPGDEEDFDFTCQFCGRQDPRFTPEALDIHYWRECPMLAQCQLCQQVIEISKMHAHLEDECEVEEQATALAREFQPNQCPLCRADLGACEDRDWENHLLCIGCPKNLRNSSRGAAGQGALRGLR